ncbi:MAG: iron-sulfur cluster assembly scaffold protein [Clostridia bacterium]|nr:iron-sulfur cluster assembly scaffold protein [Clostridia bacterium]
MDESNDKLIEAFKNPKNVGLLRGANAIGRAVDKERSDLLKIYLKIDNKKIIEARFKAFGSSSLIAISSIATTMIIGKPIDILDNFDISLIENEVGEIAPHSRYCLNMLCEALANAKENYHK